MVGDDFGFLRADFHAVAAAYAATADDLGVVLVDADRFDRAVADTGVAFTTVFLDGNDWIHNASCQSRLVGDCATSGTIVSTRRAEAGG